MGIIAAVMPRVTATKLVPKIEVLSNNIMQIGSIETHLFHRHRNSPCLKYKSLQLFSACDTAGSLGILWKSAWMLKPQ